MDESGGEQFRAIDLGTRYLGDPWGYYALPRHRQVDLQAYDLVKRGYNPKTQRFDRQQIAQSAPEEPSTVRIVGAKGAVTPEMQATAERMADTFRASNLHRHVSKTTGAEPEAVRWLFQSDE